MKYVLLFDWDKVGGWDKSQNKLKSSSIGKMIKGRKGVRYVCINMWIKVSEEPTGYGSNSVLYGSNSVLYESVSIYNSSINYDNVINSRFWMVPNIYDKVQWEANIIWDRTKFTPPQLVTPKLRDYYLYTKWELEAIKEYTINDPTKIIGIPFYPNTHLNPLRK